MYNEESVTISVTVSQYSILRSYDRLPLALSQVFKINNLLQLSITGLALLHVKQQLANRQQVKAQALHWIITERYTLLVMAH